MVNLDYKNFHYTFEETLDPDKLMMSGRQKKLRRVKYVESNKSKRGKSVWQGRPMYKSYNDDYEIDVTDLEDGEVLMLEGKFLDPDRDDNYTEAEIKKFTNRYIVEKESEDSNTCKVYELTYREAVESAEEDDSSNGFSNTQI